MMLRLLGTIEAGADSDSMQTVTAPRLRLILAYLGAHAGQRVSTDRLIDALWPDGPPKSAEASVQVHISKIRRIFEPDLPARVDSAFVTHQPGAYILELADDQLDVSALLAADADNQSDAAAALALWRDPPFAEHTDEPWAIGAATELRRAHLSLAQRHYEHAINSGGAEGVVDELRADVAAHPYDERLAMLLMEVLYQLNDQRAALDVAAALRTLLRDELGLDPTPDLRNLEHQILTHDDNLQASARGPIWPAIERSAMFGRDTELERLATALEAHRLVTLTGTGGVGKTRLARAIIDGTDRALLIDLSAANTTDEALIRLETELDVHGDPLTDRVVSIAMTMADEVSLVVLDNCEQLPDDFANIVAHIIATSGNCRVLVTSQRSLGIVAEHLMRLTPFELPISASTDTGLADRPGIRVLCESGRLPVTPDNAADLIRLHNRLDGLPLALELAAIRLRSMSIEDVVALSGAPNFEGPADLPERHRSLDALLSSSIDALSAFQQELLDAASVFAGAVPIDAFVRLLADKADPVDVRIGTAELVDRNLLTMSTDGAIRYRMLETVRHHCRERLAASGRTAELHRRHAKVVRIIASDSTLDHSTTIDIEDIHDDVNAALDHLEREPSDARRDLALVILVATAWYGNGRVPEACARLRTVLDLHSDGDPLSVGTAQALLGMVSFDTGAFEDLAFHTAEALQKLEPTGAPMLEFWRAGHHVGTGELDDARAAIDRFLDSPEAIDRMRIAGLEIAATIAWYHGDYEMAADHFVAQHELARRADDRYFTAQSLRGRAMMTALLGSPEAGLEWCRRADEIDAPRWGARTRGERHAAAALIRFEMGDRATARTEALTVLELSVQRFNARSAAIATPIAAACALDANDLKSVARLSGWFEALCGTTGLYAPPESRTLLDTTVAEARSRVAEPEWVPARADGAALGLAATLATL